MSVHLSVNESNLFIAIKGDDVFLNCRNKMNIPLKHIVSVKPYKGEYNTCFKGTKIPGIVTAGAFYQKGQKIFWNVINSHKSILIELQNNSFSQLVVEVDDLEHSIKKIKSSIGQVSGNIFPKARLKVSNIL